MRLVFSTKRNHARLDPVDVAAARFDSSLAYVETYFRAYGKCQIQLPCSN